MFIYYLSVQDQKLCCITQIKMLIRHISIPRHSQLITLAQTKKKTQEEEGIDYNSYLARTLNPEAPIHNKIVGNKHGNTRATINYKNQEEKLIRGESMFLMQEFAQELDINQRDNHNGLKKQAYKSKYDEYRDKQAYNNIIEKQTRTYLSLTPQLSNQAYLKHINHSQNKYNKNENMNFLSKKIQNQYEDQQNILAKKQWLHSDRHGVMKTLMKLKTNNKNNSPNQAITKHQKYTYSLPKHNFIEDKIKKSAIDSQKQMPLKNVKQREYISHVTLNNRKKKIMPKEEDQSQTIQQTAQMFTQKYSKNTDEVSPKKRPQSLMELHTNKAKQIKYKQAFIQTSPVQVSYRTSLLRLKQICSIKNLSEANVIIKIPQIFSSPMFSGKQTQQQLFLKSQQILKQLHISKSEISIKKYSNCIMILMNSLSLIWHFTGKVYLGGWKNQYLDEGCKNGLGLEWWPNKYVYYGQFSRNKKQGVGIMKDVNNQIVAGMWREQKLIRNMNQKSEDGIRSTQSFL